MGRLMRALDRYIGKWRGVTKSAPRRADAIAEK